MTTRQASLHATDRPVAPPSRAFDTALRRRAFPPDAGSLLPGPLAATRTGLSPVGDDELTTEDQLHISVTSGLLDAHPIESTFATVRLRQRVTKGPGSRAAGVAMAFKLIEAAQTRWRAVNAPHLVALVRAGATFDKGVLVERPDETSQASGGDQRVA